MSLSQTGELRHLVSLSCPDRFSSTLSFSELFLSPVTLWLDQRAQVNKEAILLTWILGSQPKYDK